MSFTFGCGITALAAAPMSAMANEVRMYVCIYVCLYVCVCMLCMYVRTYVRMRMCVRVCMCVCGVCMYELIYVCVCVYMPNASRPLLPPLCLPWQMRYVCMYVVYVCMCVCMRMYMCPTHHGPCCRPYVCYGK